MPLAVIRHSEGFVKVDLPKFGRGRKVVNLNGHPFFEQGSYELTHDGTRMVDGLKRNVYSITRLGETKPEDPQVFQVQPIAA